MAKAVKLADIAVRLNVSTVTVSKALAGKSGVSEEMREKIRVLADELGYKPPSASRKQVVSGNNIGVLVSERYLEKYTSFYWELYRNIATQAAKKDCFSVLEMLSAEDEKNLVLPKMVRDRKVDGVIVIGRTMKPYLRMFRKQKVLPFLYLDFYDHDPTYDSVISDGFYGMYWMTNYLFKMGHKDIAFIGTPLATSSITDRYYGYLKSLLEHGIAVREEYLIPDRDEEKGEIFDEFTLPEQMPTAFACNCDYAACHLIAQLKKNGYKVPEDISVVGFDNYSYPGSCDIGITTYDVDMKEMAKISISTMLKKINKDNYKAGIKLVSGRIIVRDSVRDINEQ